MCSRTRRKVREKLSRVTEGSEEVRNGKEFHFIIVPFFQLILAANLLMLAFNDVCSTRCCVLVSCLCQPLLPMLADGSSASTRTRSAARYTIVTSILHKCFQCLLCRVVIRLFLTIWGCSRKDSEESRYIYAAAELRYPNDFKCHPSFFHFFFAVSYLQIFPSPFEIGPASHIGTPRCLFSLLSYHTAFFTPAEAWQHSRSTSIQKYASTNCSCLRQWSWRRQSCCIHGEGGLSQFFRDLCHHEYVILSLPLLVVFRLLSHQ